MKTKFVKIPVSERLPERSGWNICFEEGEQGKCLYHFHIDTGFKNGYANDKVTHWLEEKEDHSEEMLSMLEDVKLFFQPHPHFAFTDDQESTLKQIEQLINKVKDNGK